MNPIEVEDCALADIEHATARTPGIEAQEATLHLDQVAVVESNAAKGGRACANGLAEGTQVVEGGTASQGRDKLIVLHLKGRARPVAEDAATADPNETSPRPDSIAPIIEDPT